MKKKTANTARQLLEAFLLLLEITPSTGDVFEIEEEGRVRNYIYIVSIPAQLADAMDPDDVESKLTAYLKFNAPKFRPYGALIGVCPCGYSGFLYVGITR